MHMKLTEYIKDKVLLLLLHIVCTAALCGFLCATGYARQYCLIIGIIWWMILFLWLGIGYVNRCRYFQAMEETLRCIDQRYLLGELMPASHRLEDRLYRELIRKSNKSVIERIHKIEDEKNEYREYIESWVHEIKAPITGISLMCRNHVDDLTRRIDLENRRIENYVDMALYYARSDEVYKDYMIRETDLEEVASEVLQGNRRYLIQSGLQISVDCSERAYTDRKWIAFILNQIVLNSAKYRREQGEEAWIRIYTEKKDGEVYFTEEKKDGEVYLTEEKDSGVHLTEKKGGGVYLTVEDNGVGIKAEELERIFEKGFTGSNGRKTERSTGMGLYLCQKLCKKLGIGISAESKEGVGTKITLAFPVSSYLSKL